MFRLAAHAECCFAWCSLRRSIESPAGPRERLRQVQSGYKTPETKKAEAHGFDL
jgi:hypothetical protein